MDSAEVTTSPRYPSGLSILDRMIAVDLIKTVFSVLSVMVLIIVSRKFIRVLAQAIDGQLSQETVFMILGLKTVVVISTLLPATVFIAVLMVLGRMYRDQEMAAIASAGGGSALIYKAVFLCILPLSLLGGWFALYATPWAEAEMQIVTNDDQNSINLSGISAGRFNEYNQGDLVLYVESINSAGKLENVFVQNRKNDVVGIVTADSGRVEQRDTGIYLILENGQRTQGNAGNLDYVIESFAEYGVRLEKKMRKVSLNLESMPSEQLWLSDQLDRLLELQRRLATPLGMLCLCFLAVPLAKLSPRSGVYGNLLIAFIVYFAYGNLLKINEGLVRDTLLPEWMGFVWIYLILLGTGIFKLIRLYGWHWIKMQFSGNSSL